MSVSSILAQEAQAAENLTEKTNPRLLVSIIHSLIDKSRHLITSLEKTLVRLEGVQKECVYWKEKYFSFKEQCEKAYGSIMTNTRSDSGISFSRLVYTEPLHIRTLDVSNLIKKESQESVHSPCFRIPEAGMEPRERMKSQEANGNSSLNVTRPGTSNGPQKVTVDLRRSIGISSMASKYQSRKR